MADGAHAGLFKARANDSPCHLVPLPQIRGPVAAEGRRRFPKKPDADRLSRYHRDEWIGAATPPSRRKARERMHAVSRKLSLPYEVGAAAAT